MEIVKFKKSLFGGFRRRDVLQFIEEFAGEKADEIHDLTEKVNQLQTKLNDTQAELQTRCAERNQIATERAELEERAKNQEERLAVVEEELAKVTSESKASLQLLKERDVKIAFLEDKAQKLTIKLEAVSYTHLDVYKRQDYRSLSFSLAYYPASRFAAILPATTFLCIGIFPPKSL